jgi:hypothetical protein
LVGPSVRWLDCPHITSKTDYVAIPSRLGFGDPLVSERLSSYKVDKLHIATYQSSSLSVPLFDLICALEGMRAVLVVVVFVVCVCVMAASSPSRAQGLHPSALITGCPDGRSCNWRDNF